MLNQVKAEVISFIQEFDSEAVCTLADFLPIEKSSYENYSIRLTVKGETSAYKIFMLGDNSSIDFIVSQMTGDDDLSDKQLRKETAMELLNIIAGMVISVLPHIGEDAYYFIEAPELESFNASLSEVLITPVLSTKFSDASKGLEIFLVNDVD